MSRQQAMQEYVEEITILDPSWAEIKVITF